MGVTTRAVRTLADGTGYGILMAESELVMELPQEQAAKMSQSPDYTAGQVINAKA